MNISNRAKVWSVEQWICLHNFWMDIRFCSAKEPFYKILANTHPQDNNNIRHFANSWRYSFNNDTAPAAVPNGGSAIAGPTSVPNGGSAIAGPTSVPNEGSDTVGPSSVTGTGASAAEQYVAPKIKRSATGAETMLLDPPSPHPPLFP